MTDTLTTTSTTRSLRALYSVGGRQKGGGDQALGHSRGGWGTKFHLRVEGEGRPMLFLLSGGQANDALFILINLRIVALGLPRDFANRALG